VSALIGVLTVGYKPIIIINDLLLQTSDRPRKTLIDWGSGLTFVTATWNVYSVTSLAVLLEKEAKMWIDESLPAGLVAEKTMPT